MGTFLERVGKGLKTICGCFSVDLIPTGGSDFHGGDDQIEGLARSQCLEPLASRGPLQLDRCRREKSLDSAQHGAPRGGHEDFLFAGHPQAGSISLRPSAFEKVSPSWRIWSILVDPMRTRFPVGGRPDKRLMNRFKVAGYRATSSVIDLVLKDLSAEGMAIETRRSMRVGASYPFRICDGKATVYVDGVVKWCQLRRMIDIGNGESQAIYWAGIAFLEKLDAVLRGVPAATTVPEPQVVVPVTGTRVRDRSRWLCGRSCPSCRVPVVPGAIRCRVCGAILPGR